MEGQKVTINIMVAEVTKDTYLAIAEIGGIYTRSRSQATPVEAVMNCLTSLVNGTTDGQLAVALALNGESLDSLQNQLSPIPTTKESTTHGQDN